LFLVENGFERPQVSMTHDPSEPFLDIEEI